MKKVTLPKFPVGGGCQCGKVRYLLKGAPLTSFTFAIARSARTVFVGFRQVDAGAR